MLSGKSALTRQRYAPRLIFTSEPIRQPSLRRKLKMRVLALLGGPFEPRDASAEGSLL